MIDLHNHILPGVDDGASDMAESLAIARQFVSEGVIRVVATPHLDPENSRGIHAPRIRELVGEVQTAVRVAGIQLEIESGQEIYLTPEVPDLIQTGIARCLGDSKSLLVELSLVAATPPLFLEDTLFRLQVEGYQPILAHPERYAFVQRDVEALDSLVERGLTLQLTAPTLQGYYGPTVRRTAERLLRRGKYALAASDRHHPNQDRSLSALHDHIAHLTDSDTADLLLRLNPARALAGESLVKAEGTLAEQPSLLGKLFGRN